MSAPKWREHVRVRVFVRGPGDAWIFQRVAALRDVRPEGVRITGSDTVFDLAGRAGDLARIEHVTPEGCASCGTKDGHTDVECSDRRPLCRACGVKPTCIQARANGYAPTCLFCFFERGLLLLPECASDELRAEARRSWRLRPLVPRPPPIAKYDEKTCITAGDLRAIGIPVPAGIPDVGWVSRHAVHFGPLRSSIDVAQQAISMSVGVSFSEPFRWVEVTLDRAERAS